MAIVSPVAVMVAAMLLRIRQPWLGVPSLWGLTMIQGGPGEEVNVWITAGLTPSDIGGEETVCMKGEDGGSGHELCGADIVLGILGHGSITNFHGSIDTLVKIVDQNGGYSVIPELHLPFLSERQTANVREINDPPAIREISVVIKNTFVKERLINAVADAIKGIIPEHMIDDRLKKYSIRL